ncbi:MAG: SDR family oxidoreductase [Burkholderiaceae bacterium]
MQDRSSPSSPSPSPTAAARRVVAVTGAARGIGLSICREIVHDGQYVIAILRNSARVTEVQAELGEHGRAVVCDVGSDRSVAELFANIRRHEGRLDALVNNAGVIEPIGRISETDAEQWAAAVDVNLVGAYRCVRAALPLLLANPPAADGQRGLIVNLSSGAAHRPQEGWSAYCASKAGLAMLGRSIDLEYGAQGIAVTGFAPGVVDTGMQGQIRASGINPVSRLPRESLAPAIGPARIVAALVRHCPAEYRGQEIDARDPAIAGLVRA